MFIVCVCRKLEAEGGEKLEGVYHQLMQAGVDRNESERETRLKDTLVADIPWLALFLFAV
jgi:hypothetical protein